MICVSIGAARHREVCAQMQAAAQKADLVEIRLDHLQRDPEFQLLLVDKPCPVIATCRRAAEGGKFVGSEERRLAILRQAIVAGVDYIDLEKDIAGKIRRYGATKRIVSYHNFEETPDNLEDIHNEMMALDADIVKIVTRARDPADNLRVMKLIGRRSQATVAFCLGDMGTPSRVLGRKFGSPLTFASLRRGAETAPGQLSVDDLLETYYYKQINADTQVYGLIGNPVAHSISPAVHNAAFREAGLNCVYVPFKVEDVDRFLKDIAPLNVQGYSITIPHKTAIVRHLQQADGVVRKLRAANTLVWREGKATGYNTDWRAGMEVLEEALGGPKANGSSPLQNRQVLLLGAGGVGRAMAYGIAGRGALLTICNRTEAKAKALAQQLNCRYVPFERVNTLIPDVIVNCTSVGMYPDVDKCPIHPSVLREGQVVFDSIYNPAETRLVREGRLRGCRVVPGLEMFLRQAALQFHLFTNREPPLERMRAAAQRQLDSWAAAEAAAQADAE